MEIHHVALLVEDLARAERFYCDLLGLPVLRRWNDDAGAHRSTWVSVGSAFLAIELGRSAAGPHCLALSIGRGERERWRARLVAEGHAIERESAYTLYFRDPDRNLIALSHYPE